MNISIHHAGELTPSGIEAINNLAARGFGEPNPANMLADTTRHIEGADLVQRQYDDEILQAFALYRSCLWRPCN